MIVADSSQVKIHLLTTRTRNLIVKDHALRDCLSINAHNISPRLRCLNAPRESPPLATRPNSFSEPSAPRGSSLPRLSYYLTPI